MAARQAGLEAKADVALSWLLRAGVLLCAAVIAAGWIATLATPAVPQASGAPPLLSATIPVLVGGGLLPERAVAHSLADVVSGLARGNARSVIVAGLMLLIALPLARVALTAVAFALERDWLYVALAGAVFTLLMSGLLLGRAL